MEEHHYARVSGVPRVGCKVVHREGNGATDDRSLQIMDTWRRTLRTISLVRGNDGTLTKLPKWASSLRARLAVHDGLGKSDLIFVLAGHPNRKYFGAKVFADGWAPRILMSTGNPSFIADVLGYRAAATQTTAQGGHFFAYFDRENWTVERIPVGWFGTLSEIRELGRWLHQRAFAGEVMIVSVGTHLKRVRLCCRALLPKQCAVRYAAVDGTIQTSTGEEVQPESETTTDIVIEVIKVWVYRVLLLFVRRPGFISRREKEKE